MKVYKCRWPEEPFEHVVLLKAESLESATEVVSKQIAKDNLWRLQVEEILAEDTLMVIMTFRIYDEE